MSFTQDEQRYIDFLLDVIQKPQSAFTFPEIANSENRSLDEIKKSYATINEWVADKLFGASANKTERKPKLNKLVEIQNSPSVCNEVEFLRQIYGKNFAERRRGFVSTDSRSANDAFWEWVQKCKDIKNWKIQHLSDDELRQKYENGEFGFGNFRAFYEWYKKHSKDGKCEYCGTSKENLKRLLKSKDDDDEINFKKPLYAKKTSFTAELQIEKKNPNQPYRPDNCVLACAFCNNAKSDWVSHDNFANFFAEPIKKFLDKLLDDVKKGENSNEMPPCN